MNEIWANRLIAGTKNWAQCERSGRTGRTGRADAVKAVLAERVKSGDITAEKYSEITGEVIPNG